jgi:hypothetical protein
MDSAGLEISEMDFDDAALLGCVLVVRAEG